jgi:hypothetical protein
MVLSHMPHVTTDSIKGLSIEDTMTELQTKTDWLGFIVRQLPIVVLAILWLIERLRKNDRIGAFLLAGAVFAILTGLNYWRAKPSRSRPK